MAGENLAQLDREARALLEAYAGGINAFLGSERALPPEFTLFGAEPEPWTPVDSMLSLKVMAWELGGNLGREVLRAHLSKRLSPQQIAQFLPAYPGEASASFELLPEVHGALQGGANSLLGLARASSQAPSGSNSWVVDGSRSESGAPLLANDPHLRLTAPALWYLAHLHAPGYDVIGATLPGLPAVILGRNQHVAWSFTNTQSDSQDTYLEKVVPGEPAHYLTPTGQAPFVTRREVIRVRGEPDEVITVRASRHGPILSDAHDWAQEALPAGYVLALSWTALQAEDKTMQFPLAAARARSGAELLAATRDIHSPNLSIVYADTSGATGFIAAGRVPLRRADNRALGMVPSPGWQAEYDWAGFVPFEELPQSQAPATGTIVTANQKITPAGYPHWITAEWALPLRAQRIEALLEATPRHSTRTFERIQLDAQSGSALMLLGLLLESSPADLGPWEAALLQRLRTWDRVMRADGAEPLIFAAWLRELTRALCEDELGDLFEDTWAERPDFVENVLSDREGQARWCDDVRTSGVVESCRSRIQSSFVSAVRYLRDRYGADPERWRWGSAHVAHSKHAALGAVPVLGRWFDIRVPSPGDNQSVNFGGYSLAAEEPFTNRNGPGLRAIYDLGPAGRSRFMLSTGQSGHVLSPHYRDMSERWARGEYVEPATERSRLERGPVERLILRPAPQSPNLAGASP